MIASDNNQEIEWHKSNKSENGGIDLALRRFKREVSKAGIFPDIKKHSHLETPIEKHKRQEKAKYKQRKRRDKAAIEVTLVKSLVPTN